MRRIIIDLDYTLLNTTAWQQALAKSLGLSPHQWQQAYDQFRQDYGLFNPTDFLRGVPAHQRDAFQQVVQRVGHWLYSDSLPFLEQAVAAGWDVVVLTFGNEAWQRQKLRHITWPKGVATHATADPKTDILAGYLAKEMMIIDDRADELETMYQIQPQASYYWMVRPQAKYAGTAPLIPHRTITQLKDIKL